MSYGAEKLQELCVQGEICLFDYHFALALERVFPKASFITLLLAAVVSNDLSRGMIFLDVQDFMENRWTKIRSRLSPDSFENISVSVDFVEELKLQSDGCVGCVSSEMALKTDFLDFQHYPLILDAQGRLYLGKYFYFRMRLAQNIRCRMENPLLNVDASYIHKQIEKIFHGQHPAACEPQKKAVKQALLHHFSLISGGPGTGKTHITRLIISLLQEMAEKSGQTPPVVLSLAPTGKAASRLENGATIHSALIPLSQGVGFHHNRENPLSADLVIIDEGSMVDLALMTRLLEAIPLHARVVVLGDGNQLPPVQAGAVFSELCQAESMASCRAVLTHNFRFQGKNGIEKLAGAIREKNINEAQEILTSGKYADLVFHDTSGKSSTMVQDWINGYIRKEYAAFCCAENMEKALDSMDCFRILCAHNHGDLGTEQMNSWCEKILLGDFNSIGMGAFPKKMVMITSNNYQKGLANGDTGVLIPEKNRTFRMGTAGFLSPDNSEIKTFRYADLPAHESAFAVTIHKSQGSEFDHVLIVIPNVSSAVMNRQLLYTGLTRARKKVIIIGNFQVIQRAMEVDLEQTCQLADLL